MSKLVIYQHELLNVINNMIEIYQVDASIPYRNGAVDALRQLASHWFDEEEVK